MHSILQFFHKQYQHSIAIMMSLVIIGSAVANDLSQYRQTTKPSISSAASFHRALRSGQIQLPARQYEAETPFVNPFLKPQSVADLPYIEGVVTESINYDQNGVLAGESIPPDNAGAVGPDHFVITINSSVEWYEKISRQRLYQESLDTLFKVNAPQYGLFDPRVLWDPYDQRFVIIAIEQDDNSKTSILHLAVSQTTNPQDGWYFQRIDTRLEINGKSTWTDFPGLGVSSEAIYFTANMFEFNGSFQASRVWIIDKGLYTSGHTSTANVYDPSTEAGLSSQAFTIIPARMHGTQPENVGDFMFSTEWDDNNGNNDLLAIFRIDDPLGSNGGPFFNVQLVNPGEIHNNSAGVPEMPQKDSNKKIDAGDDRAQSCTWRNDIFVGAYTTNPTSGDDVGEATVFWFTVNTSNLDALSLEQQGYIGGEDIADTTYTCYPAVAINKYGEIGIGFSASAPSIYAGSYFAVHQTTDPAGGTQGAQLMRAGDDYYERTFTFGIGRNRWGDYSSITVDPTDTTSFWVFNQYAMTRGSASMGEDGRWATTFAKVIPNGIISAINNNKENAPLAFQLEQNYPNPFNPTTRIRYHLQEAGPVNLSVFNLLGQKVRQIIDTKQEAGSYNVNFNATGLASGVYVYKLKTRQGVLTRKMVLMR